MTDTPKINLTQLTEHLDFWKKSPHTRTMPVQVEWFDALIDLAQAAHDDVVYAMGVQNPEFIGSRLAKTLARFTFTE